MKKRRLYWLLLIPLLLWVGYNFLKPTDYPNSVPLHKGWKADTVRVDKSERVLQLCKRGKIYRRYSISLGANPIGHKHCEGDEKTPEGIYTLDWRMSKGSCCHKSIHISYPNQQDLKQAKKSFCSAGGSIMIHGLLAEWKANENLLHTDWTNGCIGMNNSDIDEVWKYTRDGIPICISP